MDEIHQEVERPVVQKLLALMKFRNEYEAFDGSITLEACSDEEICIVRESGDCKAILQANFKTKKFVIHYRENDEMKELYF